MNQRRLASKMSNLGEVPKVKWCNTYLFINRTGKLGNSKLNMPKIAKWQKLMAMECFDVSHCIFLALSPSFWSFNPSFDLFILNLFLGCVWGNEGWGLSLCCIESLRNAVSFCLHYSVMLPNYINKNSWFFVTSKVHPYVKIFVGPLLYILFQKIDSNCVRSE